MLVSVALNGLVCVVGVAGGYFFNVILQGGTPGAYLASFSALAQLPDLYTGEIKALIFGVIAGVVAAYKGLNAGGGPKGVGDAVNQSVVITFMLLFAVNFVITRRVLPGRPGEGLVGVASQRIVRQRPARSLSVRAAGSRRTARQLDARRAAVVLRPRARLDATTLRRYKKEVMRLLAEVVFGSGSLAVIGGTVGVIAFLCFFTGTEVGLQGYAALEPARHRRRSPASSPRTSTPARSRRWSPALALSATVGCGFTAQLGAMRISEEIDALEVMAVPSLPFLVTTRIIAGFIAVIPLYIFGLLSSYLATVLHRRLLLQPVGRHLLPLLPPVPAAARHHLVVLQGAGLRDRRSS